MCKCPQKSPRLASACNPTPLLPPAVVLKPRPLSTPNLPCTTFASLLHHITSPLAFPHLRMGRTETGLDRSHPRRRAGGEHRTPLLASVLKPFSPAPQGIHKRTPKGFNSGARHSSAPDADLKKYPYLIISCNISIGVFKSSTHRGRST